jgi:hypothetical protein
MPPEPEGHPYVILTTMTKELREDRPVSEAAALLVLRNHLEARNLTQQPDVTPKIDWHEVTEAQIQLELYSLNDPDMKPDRIYTEEDLPYRSGDWMVRVHTRVVEAPEVDGTDGG